MTETLAQIGAAGLFTDRCQLVLAQLILDPLHFRVGAHAYAQPVRLAQHLVLFGRYDLDRNTGNLVGTAQLDALLDSNGFVFGGFSHAFQSSNVDVRVKTVYPNFLTK